MSAQILYFPNQGITFRPSPADLPLTITQIEHLQYRIDSVSRRFEKADCGAAYPGQLAKKNILNKLQVTFCVRRLEDIPQSHYMEALNLVEQMESILYEFRLCIIDLKRMFADKVLRAGDPWTPTIKTKWRKELAKTLPDRPEWREMAKELEK